LMFGNSSENDQPTRAEQLIALLMTQKHLRLVFLNGCSTAGLAHRLLDAGVPAVIATDRSINDDLAQLFAGEFYQQLAQGTVIEQAYLRAVQGCRDAIERRQIDSVRRDLRPNPESVSEPASDESHDQDGWPWRLYVNPQLQGVKTLSLATPDRVRNPDILNSNPPLPSPAPFQFLRQLTRWDHPRFAGRQSELEALLQAVTNPDGLSTILLYGSTGVGKTSLLEAGLVAQLGDRYEVFHERYPMNQVLGQLEKRYGVNLSQDPGQAWLEIEKRTGKPLVVIVDRLEEVYMRPSPALRNELREMLKTLAKTFNREHGRPQGKLVLCFAKEWFAEVREALRAENLSYFDVFLKPLSKEAILQVLNNPQLLQQYRLQIDPQVADQIAYELSRDETGPIAPTLQIVLGKMWQQAQKNALQLNTDGSYTFDQALYKRVKRQGFQLEQFLHDQLEQLRTTHRQSLESGLALDVLYAHTKSTTGFFSSMELEKQYGTERFGEIASLACRLIELSLLNEVPQEDHDTDLTQIAHQLLKPMIERAFTSSERPGNLARETLEHLVNRYKKTKETSLIDQATLKLVRDGASGMRLLTEYEEELLAGFPKRKQQTPYPPTTSINEAVA
jgi:AAA+ ATPase superfamily predicted ATPase